MVRRCREDSGNRVWLFVLITAYKKIRLHPPVTLRKVHLFASRITIGIGPDLVVKTNRVDDECVSLPFANGVPQPGGVRIFGKRSPICPDGAPNVILLEEHQHPARNLNDLKWVGKSEKSRGTCRLTA